MTQKELTEALDKLQTIDPSEIADESRQTIEYYWRATQLEVKNLTQENQRLGWKQPTQRGTREAGHQSQATQRRKVISSERERKPQKGFKKIDRQQILEYPQDLPVDAEFKEVVVQDIKLTTDNVLFRKQKYSPSEGKT